MAEHHAAAAAAAAGTSAGGGCFYAGPRPTLPSWRRTTAAATGRAAAPLWTGQREASSSALACASILAALRLHRRRGVRSISRAAVATETLEAPPEEIFFRDEDAPTVELSSEAVESWGGKALVLFVRARGEGESEKEKLPELGRLGEAVDKKLSNAISEFMEEEAFDAKEGTTKVLHVFKTDVKRVVLVGLGAGSKETCNWRTAGASAAKALTSLRGGSAGLVCVDGVQVQGLVEGLLATLHADKRFHGSQKNKDKDKEPTGPIKVELLGAFPPGSTEAVERAQAVAKGIIFAREIVNGAPNIVTPPNMAAAAKDLGSRLGLETKILSEAECEAMGMGSFLAVGRASDLPSSLIHLKYSPPTAEGDSPPTKLGIVGKGLTFDSGGYNIKAGAGSMIELMKFDCGGAAATLGTAAAIGKLRPKGVEVHFVIAACENMISGNPGALRPGDIIKAMDGTTIEVNNTDAEGRLTLADAMLYCQQQGVTQMVDIATLTGACFVALGGDIAGMWSNSDSLAESLDASAKVTGEKVWRMPLEEAYFEGLKSDFADMKNTGPRWGGAITAALFLSKFIQKGVDWAHLDIAGPVWAEKPKGINSVAGGTGTMVRTLTDFVTSAPSRSSSSASSSSSS